ncbi:unnamed protein product [Protopolystoma xenopodis]|uniref:Uncharacterized protein n=1 Tax=Protopolystoma xenopodis TaxID=117903 RepID=A0A448WS45_9PLAT|nr:unnamed protein product [Protopolystoma xenopodis]
MELVIILIYFVVDQTSRIQLQLHPKNLSRLPIGRMVKVGQFRILISQIEPRFPTSSVSHSNRTRAAETRRPGTPDTDVEEEFNFPPPEDNQPIMGLMSSSNSPSVRLADENISV